MTTKQITIVIFFKSTGETAMDDLIYEYDASSQQDIDNTATACANVIAKIERVGNEQSCSLGVRIKAPPEFQQHLIAAINKTRTSSWNVSSRGIAPADC